MRLMEKNYKDDNLEYQRNLTLINAYMEVLMGESRKIPRILFGGDNNPAKRMDTTLFLLKFLLVYVLEYDEQTALEKFNFEKFKLQTVLDHGFIYMPLLPSTDKNGKETDMFILRDGKQAIKYLYAYGDRQKLKALYEELANDPSIKPNRKKNLLKVLKSYDIIANGGRNDYGK